MTKNYEPVAAGWKAFLFGQLLIQNGVQDSGTIWGGEYLDS